MLDEIIPALKSLRRLKMLTAEPEITRSLPVVDSKISFRPFINYLQTRRSEVSETKGIKGLKAMRVEINLEIA